VPQILAAGLTLPDPDLRFDEATGHWRHGPIDWDHFWQVVKGNGPMNKERLAARRQAHEEGQWVREALAAYAQRQTA
jgi:ring-1,2-phenylacetyl-CoA epoxidase subunit PaaA